MGIACRRQPGTRCVALAFFYPGKISSTVKSAATPPAATDSDRVVDCHPPGPNPPPRKRWQQRRASAPTAGHPCVGHLVPAFMHKPLRHNLLSSRFSHSAKDSWV